MIINHNSRVIPFVGGYYMCGIVGYIGYDNAKELLLKGLEKLEYRGYDSAGIAVVNDDGTKLFKEKEELLNYVKLQIIVMRMVR